MSIVLLIVGIVLLVYGINAHSAIASQAKEAITGTPTDKSMLLIVLGLIGVVVGGISAFSRRNG